MQLVWQKFILLVKSLVVLGSATRAYCARWAPHLISGRSVLQLVWTQYTCQKVFSPPPLSWRINTSSEWFFRFESRPSWMLGLLTCAIEVSQWGIEASESSWEILEGYDKGQTQVDHPREDDMAVWAHPIDIHFQCLVRLYFSDTIEKGVKIYKI